MSDQPRSVAVRDVEVRTWPQRADVVVIDPYQALVIAHFPLADPAPGKVSDLHCGYDERARRALAQLEADQTFLTGHFLDDGDDQDVRLRAVPDVRILMTELLAEYDLDLDALEFPALAGTLTALRSRDPAQLFALLCDWHDVVELHLPAGSTADEPSSWVHRAGPDRACHFHYLAAGQDERANVTEADTDDAYALFRSLVDVDLRHFSFGHALRWVYFHLTEFPGRTPFDLHALQDGDVDSR